jgi:hypothetical protein
MSLEIYIEKPMFADGFNIHLQTVDHGLHKIFRAGHLSMIEVPEGVGFADPAFRLSTQQAQHLMDQLWNCGLRPSEGSGSAGALAATQNHLKDMQKLSWLLMEKV